MRHPTPALRLRCRGLSLVEALAAVMVLQTAVLGVLYTVNAGHAHVQYGMRSVDSSELAQFMMEEILVHEYADPEAGVGIGPDTGETGRTLYDDIDDYDGFSETAGNLANAFGESYPTEFQGYARTVTVAAASQTLTDLSATISGKQITVTVTSDNGDETTLVRFVPEP